MALPALRAAVDSLEAGRQQLSRDALLAALSRDHGGDRAAVAQVLDSVSWELFGLVMGCLEQSTASSRIRESGSSTIINGDELSSAAANTQRQAADEIAALAEELALELAEIFSPKELHIMALEHLHAYGEKRTVRTILAVLRRSTQRMPPTRRAKFLEAAFPPALKATKRVAESGAGSPPQRRHAGDMSDNGGDSCGEGDGDGGDRQQGTSSQPSPPVAAEHEHVASRAACEAAASAAETAAEFVGPLLEQASAERDNFVRDSTEGGPTTDRGGGEGLSLEREAGSAGAQNGAAGSQAGWSGEDVLASDLSLAAYVGFALSALELAGETSACMAAAAPAAAVATPPDASTSALPPFDGEKSAAVETLARAEDRLVGLVIDGPITAPFDLQFVLLHGCRLSYADRGKRRRLQEGGEGDGDRGERVRGPERERASLSAGCAGGGLFGLAGAAVDGALPWTLGGVSMVAYLVACRPKIREKWLPLVWSRRTERRLFLPHSEVLMRSKSKRVACKGLELACFVAERLGHSPNHAGAFAFEWEPEGDSVGGWGGGEQEQAANTATASTSTTTTAAAAAGTGEGARLSHPRRKPWDPHRFDLAAFLQVLVDVMVSCPLPALRARGHAALSSLLGAAGEASRFRVLERLVERCPWPNATGLLLDCFRREVDRALRQHRVSPAQERGEGEQRPQEMERMRHGLHQRSPPCEAAAAAAAAAVSERGSPFASALAGDFVSRQLRRACRKGPPGSLMLDMDTRTGALTLARYAHALDFDGRVVGVARGGRLKLREPERLRENRRLVQDFLEDLRGAAVTADSAGPEHFRLFILEDAAQQCLEELQR
eukprot:g2703.t1